MRIYTFSSPDISSSNGTATAVVLADSRLQAGVLVKQAFRDRGREDLVKGIKHLNPSRPASKSGVIYDDIEGS